MAKKILTLFLQIAAGLGGSFALGIAGLIIGSTIGGNIGFPGFGGAASGYEAGGVFFALAGIVGGGLVASLVGRNKITNSARFLAVGFTVPVIFLYCLFLYNYYMPLYLLLVVFILPTLVNIAIIYFPPFEKFKGLKIQ